MSSTPETEALPPSIKITLTSDVELARLISTATMKFTTSLVALSLAVPSLAGFYVGPERKTYISYSLSGQVLDTLTSRSQPAPPTNTAPGRNCICRCSGVQRCTFLLRGRDHKGTRVDQRCPDPRRLPGDRRGRARRSNSIG